jgi:hypothetical protein
MKTNRKTNFRAVRMSGLNIAKAVKTKNEILLAKLK